MAKKPGLDVAIIAKPHRPGADLSAPGPLEHGAPPAPGDNDGDEQEPDGDEGGVGPEDVGYSDNDLCETCKNMGQDGNCSKYNFPVDQTGHCEGGYEPMDQGGAPHGSPAGGPGGPVGAPPTGGYGQS